MDAREGIAWPVCGTYLIDYIAHVNSSDNIQTGISYCHAAFKTFLLVSIFTDI